MMHGGFFDESRPIAYGRAPGRLDVMGGVADYSGSLVLQLPTRVEATAGAQWGASRLPMVTVRTTSEAAAEGPADVSLPLEELLRPYDEVRARWGQAPETRWAAYVAGAATVLHHELGVEFRRGVRMLVASDVPSGKGVASSAAIEVAAMRALATLLDLEVPPRELALLCQKVENLIVGAPCGVMDQMTAACGTRGSLLALLCQPAELLPPIELPGGLAFFGIDSGIRHAVSGSDYGSVRVGAFMGYRIIANLAGLKTGMNGSLATVDDPIWNGYLANVAPAEWESKFRERVPARMPGAEFLSRFGGTTDAATTVDRDRDYAVRQPTAHPIHEHERVRRFRSLLVGIGSGGVDDATMVRLGELMAASHQSYGACGLGSDGTDVLVAMVRETGPAAGLFGAKITGGGSGGTVAVLARPDSRPVLDAIVARYRRETGRPAGLID